MNSLDSTVKIVTQYFSAITKEPFEFNGKTYWPKDLRVSPSIFTRTMICHANCGGCCKKLTLDYLPQDDVTPEIEAHLDWTTVDFNGYSVLIRRDNQKGNASFFCRHLRHSDARCSVHGNHPFSCDFELLRFSMMSNPKRPNQLAHRPFGRGWNMRIVDGTRGAKCEWNTVDFDPSHQKDVIRKLERLADWADHFDVKHDVNSIIRWVEIGPHKDPLIVRNENDS